MKLAALSRSKIQSDLSEDENKVVNNINSMKLIHLVRGYEQLYNAECNGYTDKNAKELIWERINAKLFPQYDGLSANLKLAIRQNVRRRWKSLRNALSREIKKNPSVENFVRKKESPIIAELEFLLPHIKTSNCARLADELGLRDQTYEANDTADYDDESSNKEYVDLTDPETKLQIKMDDSFHNNSNDSTTQDDNMQCSNGMMDASDILYPTVQINTSDHPFVDGSSNKNSWSNEYCAVAHYRGGDFHNSTVIAPHEAEAGADSATAPTGTKEAIEQQLESAEQYAKKRKIEEAGTATLGMEMQSQILKLLNNLEQRDQQDKRSEQEANDEDRMFLLSLVSDLKRIPVEKKMLVKAEITMSIARAMHPSPA